MKRLLYILVLLLLPYSVSAKTKAEKMGWNLAVQTFTFYPTDLCTVIDKSLELGVKYLEVFPGQKIGGKWGDRVFDYNLDVSTCKELLKYTVSKGVKIVGTGVFVPGKSDEWEREFAFAKTIGANSLVLVPMWDTGCAAGLCLWSA